MVVGFLARNDIIGGTDKTSVFKKKKKKLYVFGHNINDMVRISDSFACNYLTS